MSETENEVCIYEEWQHCLHQHRLTTTWRQNGWVDDALNSFKRMSFWPLTTPSGLQCDYLQQGTVSFCDSGAILNQSERTNLLWNLQRANVFVHYWAKNSIPYLQNQNQINKKYFKREKGPCFLRSPTEHVVFGYICMSNTVLLPAIKASRLRWYAAQF